MIRPSGRVRKVSKSLGSGRVGLGGVQNINGRVGSGRVRSGRVGSGRVGSGEEISKSHGSCEVTLTRSKPREVIRPVIRP